MTTRGRWPKASGPGGLALGLAAFFILFVLPRGGLVFDNVLWWDDFAVPTAPEQVYLGSYRPLLYLEYALFERIWPGHFWAGLPKWSGSLYMAAAGLLLVAILRRWGVRPVAALVAGVSFLVHPVLTEAGIWSSIHALGLGLVCCLAGTLVWGSLTDGRRILAGTLLVLVGVHGYQTLIAVPLTLTLAEAATRLLRGEPADWKRPAKGLALLLLVGLIHVGYVEATRRVLPEVDRRGGLTTLRGLTKSLAQLSPRLAASVVNVYMPPLSRVMGPEQAGRAWKYVPAVFCLATLLASRRARRSWRSAFVLGAAPAILPFSGVLPFLLTKSTYYAWRGSVPVLLGAVLALALLLDLVPGTRRGVALSVALGCLVAYPSARATVADASRRHEAAVKDLALVRATAELWRERGVPDRGFGFVVGAGVSPKAPQGFADGEAMTAGYDLLEPLTYSAFSDPWVAREMLSTYLGYPVVDCSRRGKDPVCTEARDAVREVRSPAPCFRSTPVGGRPLSVIH